VKLDIDKMDFFMIIWAGTRESQSFLSTQKFQ